MRSEGGFDWTKREQEIAELEARSADPQLWDDPATAQDVMQQLAWRTADLEHWHALEEQINTTFELSELADPDDEAMIVELNTEEVQLGRQVDQLEIETLLSGKYDGQPAFLQINSGAGGVDSQDWAQMLERMYVRWAEQQGWRVAIVDEMPGDEAGIKSATLEIRGPHAYGYAKAETGVHRLVRLSPFDSAHRRHTSFARVEVMPEVDDSVDIDIDPDDLRVDVYRSGGHGGQGVNTTDSAVRLTYKPGTPDQLVVTCQNERSQIQNKATAMKVLRGRLLERELQRQREARLKLRGEYRDAAWGNQIRSYVLDDRRVKDHRTNVESSNPPAVLDGGLNEFIAAYLRDPDLNAG
ncbi:MAG: peptide chain release factor 2 [Herpetosiphonaceae bacterium]|nr:peptide chain release factor 2 [Herpetosiphonaceae bacterium]